MERAAKEHKKAPALRGEEQEGSIQKRKQGLLLAVYLVRNSELLTTFCTTSSEYAATISRQHALTETVLVVSLSVVGLECPFHCFMFYFLFRSMQKFSCKNSNYFLVNQAKGWKIGRKQSKKHFLCSLRWE